MHSSSGVCTADQEQTVSRLTSVRLCRMTLILQIFPFPPSTTDYDSLARLLDADSDFEADDTISILGMFAQRIAWAAQLGMQACQAVDNMPASA